MTELDIGEQMNAQKSGSATRDPKSCAKTIFPLVLEVWSTETFIFEAFNLKKIHLIKISFHLKPFTYKIIRS